MAKREMIVSGYVGADADKQVDSFLRHLLGKFTDSLSEVDRALYDYTAIAGLPDLYFATYDTEKFTLEATDSSSPGVVVGFGYEPRSDAQWRRLRETLNYALELANMIDEDRTK